MKLKTTVTNEQSVIEQLSQYRQKKARIQVLSNYSVGAGITVSRLNEDDQLQELHRKLRGCRHTCIFQNESRSLKQSRTFTSPGTLPALRPRSELSQHTPRILRTRSSCRSCGGRFKK